LNLNVSIILLGEDKDFLHEISISREAFTYLFFSHQSFKYFKQVNKVYIPKAMNRGEDMCFGVWACDSILLTASSSTYAWWIAYLLEQADANVFYNSDFNHSYYDKENFPSDWIPLRLDSNLGRIIMD